MRGVSKKPNPWMILLLYYDLTFVNVLRSGEAEKNCIFCINFRTGIRGTINFFFPSTLNLNTKILFLLWIFLFFYTFHVRYDVEILELVVKKDQRLDYFPTHSLIYVMTWRWNPWRSLPSSRKTRCKWWAMFKYVKYGGHWFLSWNSFIMSNFRNYLF
jgi:hypothetical protein